MPWVDKVPAIMQGWYLGSESGNALAQVIFGEVNPSGHLPFTFPVALTDNSAHSVGEWPGARDVHYTESIFVGYRWADKEQIKALFPFGHGLSYTTFEIAEPTISKTTMKANGQIDIKCKITNTGKREGAEVVQLYIGDKVASLPRPVKELKGFQKLHLEAGQSGIAEFSITADDLKFLDADKHVWIAEQGEFTAYIATSTEEILYTIDFSLK
jgi:beta-glucosidase